MGQVVWIVSVFLVVQCVTAVWRPPYRYGFPRYNYYDSCNPCKMRAQEGCGCYNPCDPCQKKETDCHKNDDYDDGKDDNHGKDDNDGKDDDTKHDNDSKDDDTKHDDGKDDDNKYNDGKDGDNKEEDNKYDDGKDDPVDPPVTCDPCALPPSGIRDNTMHLEVKPSCPASQATCVFRWNLTQIMTMMMYNNKTGAATPIIYQNGCFLKITNCGQTQPATLEDLAQVIQVDGTQRYVMAINGQVPGPMMVVYENQTVKVVVHNDMISEGTGIHWHGLFQKGTPWMDGVTSVTQCPINVQETFVYRFKPEPRGTHWYHSHTALQRTNGLFGAFIILPVVNRTELPIFDKDFVAIFHEWHHLHRDLDYHSDFYYFQSYIKDDFNSSCSTYPVGTVINGKGMLDSRNISPCWKTITTYVVEGGMFYKFRFLNTGVMAAYVVEIEQHKMVVIASDGSPLQPFTVDNLVIHIGETYDIYIEANQPINNYWITFRKISNLNKQVGYAILQYQGANTSALPIDRPRNCPTTQKCVVGNCPAKNYPPRRNNYTCINIGDMNYTGSENHFDVPADPTEVEDHFLVFALTLSPLGGHRSSINAINFEIPSKPPQVYRSVDFDNPCSKFDCDNEPCICTNMFNITKGKVIQVVFAAVFLDHPIHMHGHVYQVVKEVYGQPGSVHPDINCRSSDSYRCTNPTWTKSSWLGGNVPGLNTVNPPEKDTTIVPAGGYIIVRFTANNFGWWMVHCHSEVHLADGMSIIMQEGEPSDMVPPPIGFPTCGTFLYDQGSDPGL